MDNDLKIILEFLARYEGEVEGRAVAEPEPETAALLLRVAKGQCTPEERDTACGLLKGNRSWLPWVANRIKALRFDSLYPSSNDGAAHSES